MADLRSNTITSHVAIQIKALIQEAEPFFPAECCTYRVPYEIRKCNPDAYTPKVVSIGPFHYGHGRLPNMEGQKLIYFTYFLQKSRIELEDLVRIVEELEPRVRGSYSENIQLSKEDFVKMILVDCAFVIMLFLGHYEPAERRDNDAILSTPWLLRDIRLDLLMLENQLPLLVFEKLYYQALCGGCPLEWACPSFLDLTFDFFGDDWRKFSNVDNSVAHFTDLLRTCYLQSSMTRPERSPKLVTHLHSATELNEAGVKFMASDEASNKCLLDLKFSGSILKIPRIKVQDSTEILLRNMVALEQCYYPEESYITDYIQFLDFLINTEKDVDFLIRKGIIVSELRNSYKVAELFNGLLKNVTQTSVNTNYLLISDKLNAYYRQPWNRIKASLRRDYCNAPGKTLRRDYCSTPWQTAATFAAITLLVLTVVQTVCSVLQIKLS